jgi:hypothetical protein
MASIRPHRVLLASAVLVAATMSVTACSGVRRAVGADKVSPDEFRVVTKAPLVVPPEYNLRPPAPGEPRAADLVTEEMAASAAYADYSLTTASSAEQLLVSKLAGGQSESVIRAQIDIENGVIQKRRGFANRILFWREGDTADEEDPTRLAAEDEIARRVELGTAATGEGDVQIGSRGKLPGL